MGMDAGKQIADFLAFLKAAEARYLSAQEEERQADSETQDILHAAEFQWYDGDGGGLMAKLSAVRQTRRQAKKDKEITGIVVNWITSNSKAIHSLERLQGDVQTAIRHTENRAYSPRTNILVDYDRINAACTAAKAAETDAEA